MNIARIGIVASSGGSAVPFSPSDLAGLKLWLKSDVGITLNGSNVSQWADQSGTGNNFLQNTASNQPLLVNNILNGKPVIRFDGSNDFMVMNNSIDIAEAFIVVNWGGGQSVFPEYNGIITRENIGPNDIIFIAHSGSSNFYISEGIFVNNIYINGVLTVNFAPLADYKKLSGRRVSSVNVPNLLIGRDRDQLHRSWNGNIVEIIIYNTALSSADRILVETYLSDRYAI